MALMRIIAAVATLLAAAAPAPAQDWPTRPVTIIVPFAAGGAFDVMVRVFSPHLTQILGQQVIVDNIGAAAGTVGTSRAAKAAPDGYTVLFGSVGTFAASVGERDRGGVRIEADEAHNALLISAAARDY